MPGAVFWPVRSIGNETGNYIGYSTANLGMMRALARVMPVVDDPDRADGLAVSLCHPLAFRAFGGLSNVLFTMYEADKMPEEFVSPFARADRVVVPALYSKQVFRAGLKAAAETERELAEREGREPEFDERLANIRIDVCPLGIETDLFTYKRRRRKPGKPFRWLAVCAPNPRKWTVLEEAFGYLRRFYGDAVELYVKTTAADLSRGLEELRAAGADWRVERTPSGEIVHGAGSNRGWIVDNRRLSRQEMPAIYHAADGFAALHMGEGFGLTPLEAMATGLPCVVTDATGTQDFVRPDTGYPVAVDRGMIPVESRAGVRFEIEGIMPRLDSAIDQMATVMEDPHRALVIGRRAADVASRYSWSAAALRLRTILRS